MSEARCHRCQGREHLRVADPCAGRSHLIEGDGPAVCRPCVALLGGLAGDPHGADNRVLTALLDRHGDIVRLERTPPVRGVTDAALAWVWDETWPSTEARR